MALVSRGVEGRWGLNLKAEVAKGAEVEVELLGLVGEVVVVFLVLRVGPGVDWVVCVASVKGFLRAGKDGRDQGEGEPRIKGKGRG